jgi:hypothetical protein
MPKLHTRRIKLINVPLQMKLTFIFVGMAAVSLLLQVLLFTKCLGDVAAMLPHDGAIFWAQMRSVFLGVFLTSTLAFLPLIFLIGVLTTFRIAGPLYRLETYLSSIVRGEEPSGLKLRQGDELQKLAELLNQALEVTRARAALPVRSADQRQTAGTVA